MGYKVRYNPYSEKKFPVRRSRSKKEKYIIVTVILVLVFLVLLPFYKNGQLKELLIPGDAAATEAAFERLVDELKNGVPVKAAITAFCEEIIKHESVY